MDTSAILGFTNSLLDVIKRERPDHLAVCFDKGGSDVRNEMFEAYKANRDETPEAIKIAGLAHANNRMMCPHDCTGPVVWIANLHISLAFPTAMILESVRAFYNGFYQNLVTDLPIIENGFAFPMNGTGLGTELKDTLLNSPDTIIKKTTVNDL